MQRCVRGHLRVGSGHPRASRRPRQWDVFGECAGVQANREHVQGPGEVAGPRCGTAHHPRDEHRERRGLDEPPERAGRAAQPGARPEQTERPGAPVGNPREVRPRHREPQRERQEQEQEGEPSAHATGDPAAERDREGECREDADQEERRQTWIDHHRGKELDWESGPAGARSTCGWAPHRAS